MKCVSHPCRDCGRPTQRIWCGQCWQQRQPSGAARLLPPATDESPQDVTALPPEPSAPPTDTEPEATKPSPCERTAKLLKQLGRLRWHMLPPRGTVPTGTLRQKLQLLQGALDTADEVPAEAFDALPESFRYMALHLLLEALLAGVDLFGTTCVFCRKAAATEYYGVCPRCRDRLPVEMLEELPRRNYHASNRAMDETDYQPTAAEPTDAAPGSVDKIRLLRRRLARGEALHQPGDAGSGFLEQKGETAELILQDALIKMGEEHPLPSGLEWDGPRDEQGRPKEGEGWWRARPWVVSEKRHVSLGAFREKERAIDALKRFDLAVEDGEDLDDLLPKPRQRGSSGVPGVVRNARGGGWQAVGRRLGGTVALGVFQTIDAAAAAMASWEKSGSPPLPAASVVRGVGRRWDTYTATWTWHVRIGADSERLESSFPSRAEAEAAVTEWRARHRRPR